MKKIMIIVSMLAPIFFCHAQQNISQADVSDAARNWLSRDYNLDLSKVKSGNYLLVINGTETKKIIKL